MRCFNKTLLMILAASLSGVGARDCFGYEVSAGNIYMQASKNNTKSINEVLSIFSSVQFNELNYVFITC